MSLQASRADDVVTVTPPSGVVPAAEVELVVSGMTCGSCAARIERKLNRLDGVEATVNFATSTAWATVPAGGSAEELVEVVRRLGYDATTAQEELNEKQPEQRRLGPLEWRLLVALVLSVPVMDLSLGAAFVPDGLFTGWQWVLLALAVPLVTWCAWPFHRAAFLAARHRSTTMDTLISTGIIATTVLSGHAVLFDASQGRVSGSWWRVLLEPAGAVYFDVIAGIVVFVLIGRVVESSARHRAGNAMRALVEAAPREATILRADGTEIVRPASQVRIGDRVLVRPGARIPVDGEVLDGRAAVDASSMTGESVPVEVTAGGVVASGTTCLDGRLVVRADRVGDDTQFARLVNMVERAQADKSAAQRLADRVSSVFVPGVMLIAVLTLAAWWWTQGSFATAINPALSVLVVACPCALGLATPAALMVASGRAARLGIFIKNHQAVETARAIDTILLDKTGTVTEGRLAVVDELVLPGRDPLDVLRLVAAVEEASEHAIARALGDHAATLTVAGIPGVEHFSALPGLGARGLVDGVEVLIGSRRLLDDHAVDESEEVLTWRTRSGAQSRPTVLVAFDGQVVAAYAMADAIRPTAAAAVRALRDLGLHTVLLTGDNATAAHAVADSLEIDEVMAEVLPSEKAEIVQRLQADGAVVAMVGDGINDAPALARADLGLAVARGTDVAKGASDLLLLADDLRAVPAAISLSRETVRTIRLNLGWAFGYNAAAIPLAAIGLLNPLVAAFTMAFSSVFVLMNSLRLDRVPLTSPAQPVTRREARQLAAPS